MKKQSKKKAPTKDQFRDVFVQLIVRAFRHQFGLPIARLQWLAEFMLQPEANHFRYALDRARAGMVVLLFTNLTSVFQMETDVDLEERLHLAYFRHDGPEAYFLLKVNPIVNELLTMTTTPAPLPITDDKYALVRKGERLSRTETLEELHALALLRTHGNRSITFEFKEDRLTQAFITREEEPGADLAKLREEEPFQEITIGTGDGSTRSVTRRISKKLLANLNKRGQRIPIVVKVVDPD